MSTNACLTKLFDTTSVPVYLKCSHMNDCRRVTAPFVFLYQTECMLTMPKCTDQYQTVLCGCRFSKGHIQMPISVPRDNTEWNCRSSIRPAFSDGPPIWAI